MKFNNKNILLLPLNPRYTEIKNIDFEKIEKNKKNEIETANNILCYEGNYDDLLELLKSINKNGFMSVNQKILIKLDNDKNNYYVIEGNRRTLCLKLIKKEIDYKKLNWLNDEDNYSDKKNKFDKISEILDNPNPIIINDNWFEDISEYELSYIWKLIYSKHVGEEIGKRNWSRAKYLKELLNKYQENLNDKKNNKENIEDEKIIKNVSEFFHKKEKVIENDIRNAIWVIKIIEKYKNYFKDKGEKIELLNLEISNLEILPTKKIYLSNEYRTIRDVLGIDIDLKKIDFSFDEKYKKNEKEIIEFIISHTIFDRKITTREIKEEILDEFSEILGYKFQSKKSALFEYNNLKNKSKTSELEKSKIKFYNTLVDYHISNEIIINDYDSTYVKAIKRLINNDLKTLSNLRSYDSDNYPFINVAMSIRTILDLLILEMITRIWESLDKDVKKFRELFEEYFEEDDLKFLENFCTEKIDKYNVHNVNEIVGHWINFSRKTTCIGFVEKIFYTALFKKFKKNFLELKFNLQEIINSSMNLLNIRIDNKNFEKEKSKNNINLLNDLIHKPYIIDFYKDNDNKLLYDNLASMFENLKSLLIKVNILSTKK